MPKKSYLIFGLLFCSAFLAGCTTQEPKAVTDNQEPIIVDSLPSASSTAITYTLGDVASHSKDTDCWTAVNGKVYDITGAIKTHEGGPIITTACGKEASDLFNSKHSEQAKAMLESFYLGNLIK